MDRGWSQLERADEGRGKKGILEQTNERGGNKEGTRMTIKLEKNR